MELIKNLNGQGIEPYSFRFGFKGHGVYLAHLTKTLLEE